MPEAFRLPETDAPMEHGKHAKEFSEGPKESPEKQVDSLVLPILEDFQGQLNDEKVTSYEDAKDIVAKGMSKLNETFDKKEHAELIKQLDLSYTKKYENILTWGIWIGDHYSNGKWSVNLMKPNSWRLHASSEVEL